MKWPATRSSVSILREGIALVPAAARFEIRAVIVISLQPIIFPEAGRPAPPCAAGWAYVTDSCGSAKHLVASSLEHGKGSRAPGKESIDVVSAPFPELHPDGGGFPGRSGGPLPDLFRGDDFYLRNPMEGPGRLPSTARTSVAAGAWASWRIPPALVGFLNDESDLCQTSALRRPICPSRRACFARV